MDSEETVTREPRTDPAAISSSAGHAPRTVILLGIVSFFADVSGEMIYPLIPIFLTTTLGTPIAVVGLIEGIAEGTASLGRVASGWWSDRIGRRLPLIVGGYGVAALAKLMLAAATGWGFVLLARFVDRCGKGVRGGPRDALIADATAPADRGRAFGFHRSLDTAGAVIGPLLALLLAALFHDRLRWVFLIAAVPGFLSLVPFLALHEPRQFGARSRVRPNIGVKPALSLRGLDPQLRVFLLASLVFALGNSSDVFLLLRARDLGLSTTATVLAYVLYNFVFMAASLPAGIVSDRRGRRDVFVLGLMLFAIVYGGFAAADRAVYVWPLFAVYGLYIALTDGVGKALITDVAPREGRATALGVYGMVTGLAALFASILAGQLWDHVGPTLPFVVGAVAALGGGVIALIGLPRRESV